VGFKIHFAEQIEIFLVVGGAGVAVGGAQQRIGGIEVGGTDDDRPEQSHFHLQVAVGAAVVGKGSGTVGGKGVGHGGHAVRRGFAGQQSGLATAGADGKTGNDQGGRFGEPADEADGDHGVLVDDQGRPGVLHRAVGVGVAPEIDVIAVAGGDMAGPGGEREVRTRDARHGDAAVHGQGGGGGAAEQGRGQRQAPQYPMLKKLVHSLSPEMKTLSIGCGSPSSCRRNRPPRWRGDRDWWCRENRCRAECRWCRGGRPSTDRPRE